MLGFSTFYIILISLMTKKDIPTFLIETALIIFINVSMYLRIKWSYNCKVILYNDKVELNVFTNKKAKNYFENRIYPISFGSPKQRRGRRLWVLQKEEILYKDITEFGRKKDLKTKIYGACSRDLEIITKDKKCYIQQGVFSDRQVEFIEARINKVLNKAK